MLSAVLRSNTAFKISIKIINAFVEMRRFIQNNAQVFARLDSIEQRQLVFESETERNFEKVFLAQFILNQFQNSSLWIWKSITNNTPL